MLRSFSVFMCSHTSLYVFVDMGRLSLHLATAHSGQSTQADLFWQFMCSFVSVTVMLLYLF